MSASVYRRCSTESPPTPKPGSPASRSTLVVQRGVNDGSILDTARHFKGSSHTLRLIEYMDVDTTNGWRPDDVVPARDIVQMLDREFGIDPVGPSYRGEVAQRWRYRDGIGEVGVIASVTQQNPGHPPWGVFLGTKHKGAYENYSRTIIDGIAAGTGLSGGRVSTLFMYGP